MTRPTPWKFLLQGSTAHLDDRNISREFVGKRVRVRTRDEVNGRRSFLGILSEVAADGITLAQDGKEFYILFSMIEKSNYEHDWSR